MRTESCSSILRFVVLLVLNVVFSQDVESIAKEVGATFCKYLAYKNQIPRKYFDLCGEPSCNWDDWNDASASKELAKKERIVLSYGHNGFGNQLWEHSVAFMIAESLKAKLMIAIIPDELSPGGYIPPNSWQGMSAMERMLPKEFQYELLPVNSSIRTLCDQESFIIADRPVDWRDRNYTSNFKRNLVNIINDPKPRCIKLLGYFQNLPLCAEDTKRLWTPALFQNVTIRPGDNDISIYLRCLPRHYHFNGRHFYESILNHTHFDNVWLFQAPECPNKLNENPSKDGIVASVVRLLKENYGAKRWPGLNGTDGTAMLLHDLAGLAMSKKLILPVSSWAFWGGMFSNATEIHVNAPPHHSVMYGQNQYIYHNEKTKEFFGSYSAKLNDIIYKQNLTNHHHNKLRAKAVMKTHSNNVVVKVEAYVADKNNLTSSSTAVGTNSPAGGNSGTQTAQSTGTSVRLPVVFVYTVVPAICPGGLPSYIRIALEQAIFTQPDCDVILVSNFAECAIVRDSVKNVANLKLIDSTTIVSNRTIHYKNVSSTLFMTDGGGELWMTSALRFFIMEDLMLHYHYTEMIHVEADNMIYGKYTSLLPVLRSGYPGMAATPLNAHVSFITASVMWISSFEALYAFNNFLLALGANTDAQWDSYLTWLRPYGCCKPGGIAPDKDNNGIKPFAINEMSMLAYYHEIQPLQFKIFPVVPAYPYMLNRHVINMSHFGPGGEQVGPATGHGIWDPNSWGQLIGGTATKKGRDKGFTDASHIAGQAIRMNQCKIEMLCGNQTISPYAAPPVLHSDSVHTSSSSNSGNSDSSGSNSSMNSSISVDIQTLNPQDRIAWQWWVEHQETQCYTAPFVRCGESTVWTPLWNLHVHSKHTQDYRSVVCACPGASR